MVKVGNEYRRTLGAVKQFVTVEGVDELSHKWLCLTKSGKRFTATDEAISKWELLKEAETAEAVEVAEKPKADKAKRAKNATTCLDAAIATLAKHGVPMNAKTLVKTMIADGAFAFSSYAKTPWNSVGTRLATYLKQCAENGEECRIKQVSRGMYATADYEAEEE